MTPPKPAQRNPWRMLDAKERLGLAAIVGVAVLFIIMFAMRGSDRDFAERQLHELYEAESIMCRVVLGQGQRITPQGPCLDAVVLTHYDPWAVCGRLRSNDPANTCEVSSRP